MGTHNKLLFLTSSLTIIATLLFVVTGASKLCVADAAPSDPNRVTLSDLSFVTGLWHAEWDGGLGEEHWGTPSGGSMIGTFRFVKNGKAQFYELMLIEETPDGLVLRLKHFNAGLIGWEEKAQVYSYPLVKYGRGLAVFERVEKKSRLTYQQRSKSTLSVLLEESHGDKQNIEEFRFIRVKQT